MIDKVMLRRIIKDYLHEYVGTFDIEERPNMSFSIAKNYVADKIIADDRLKGLYDNT